MKIFRQHRDEPPKVDIGGLAQRAALVGLDRTLAHLAVDRPGDAPAVAAAGIGWLATTRAPIDMAWIGPATSIIRPRTPTTRP